MSWRKGEITARMNERDYPHIVELPLPFSGFRSQSDELLAFHRERGIRAGRSGGRRRAFRCPRLPLRPRQHVAHRFRIPLATSRRADPPCVESVRYLVERRSARALYLADDRQHVGCVTAREGLDRRCGTLPGGPPARPPPARPVQWPALQKSGVVSNIIQTRMRDRLRLTNTERFPALPTQERPDE
jgi:hypothetical protein